MSKQFHKAPPFKPLRRPARQVLDAVADARPIDQSAPEGAVESPGFTDQSEGDSWHQVALRYADRIAEGRGSMVTTIKTGNEPTADGSFPATAFLKGGGRFYFSGVRGARGWIITPRKGRNVQFDVEKGRHPGPAEVAV